MANETIDETAHKIALVPGSKYQSGPEFNKASASNHLAVEMVAVDKLQPYPGNAHTHPKKQRKALKAAIREFGFNVPILIDGDDAIVAGELRADVAKELGFGDIPAIRITHLSEAQIRAFIIAENRVSELGEWDTEKLAAEFDFLASVNFNVELTGFEAPEIDIVLAEQDEDDEFDDHPILPSATPSISRLGDLWLLGTDHRLLCGNALNQDDYTTLLRSDKASMVFTDPPYNVPIAGHVSGLGSAKHREFAMAAGEMSDDGFTGFLETVFNNLAAATSDGSLHFICMDWRHLSHALSAGSVVYDELKNICIWAKSNGGMGSLDRSQHEEVLVFKNGTAPHINNVELGRHGRNRSNVWRYPGMNSFGKNRDADLALHPTVKPTSLVADAIMDCSNRGDTILDPFAGSGTIFLAAEKTGRRGYGIELDPAYVDVAIKRWETMTGGLARHAETKLTFAETALKRSQIIEPAVQGTEATNV